MKNTWVVSDTHWGHQGVTQFLTNEGEKLRPWDNPDEMDEAMIELWNDRVKPGDRVYHLGDVVINRRCLKTLSRLNGNSVLVKGNHDIFRINEYLEYFDDVRAYIVKNGIIMSHIPIHPNQLERFGCNVHGHSHSNRVLLDNGQIDPRYWCACVEQIGFAPIHWDEMIQKIKDQGGSVEMKQGNR